MDRRKRKENLDVTKRTDFVHPSLASPFSSSTTKQPRKKVKSNARKTSTTDCKHPRDLTCSGWTGLSKHLETHGRFHGDPVWGLFTTDIHLPE